MANVKVGITIDDALLARLDAFADANYMSRSGFFSLAVTQYLNSQEAFVAIKNISLAMRKIADTGEIDDDLKQQLEDYERVAKMFMSSK